MFYRRYANVEYTKTGKATTFKNQHISIAFLSIPHFYRFHSCTITTIFLLSILYHHRHHISIVSLPHLHYHISVVLPPPLPPPHYHISIVLPPPSLPPPLTTFLLSSLLLLHYHNLLYHYHWPHLYCLPSSSSSPTSTDHSSIVFPPPPPPPPLATLYCLSYTTTTTIKCLSFTTKTTFLSSSPHYHHSHNNSIVSLHHQHHNHISVFRPPPLPLPRPLFFYNRPTITTSLLSPSTTTITTFLLSYLLHYHHISIVFRPSPLPLLPPPPLPQLPGIWRSVALAKSSVAHAIKLGALSICQNWLARPLPDQSVSKLNRPFPRVFLKNHLLREYYSGFDWPSWIVLINSEILVTTGKVWQVSSDKRKAPRPSTIFQVVGLSCLPFP